MLGKRVILKERKEKQRKRKVQRTESKRAHKEHESILYIYTETYLLRSLKIAFRFLGSMIKRTTIDS